MTAVNDKETSTTPNGRRKFLLRAGLGSLPVLLSLKSKAAWGTSTLNCSLSETASQMQSVQPDKFEQCKYSFESHGSAKLYFDEPTFGERQNIFASRAFLKGDGKGSYFYKPTDWPIHQWNKTYLGIKIFQDTLFSDIFDHTYGGTLAEAVNLGGNNNLLRNISAVFLHALYYQIEGVSTNLPSPDQIISAYLAAVTNSQREQLAALLTYYIDGEPV